MNDGKNCLLKHVLIIRLLRHRHVICYPYQRFIILTKCLLYSSNSIGTDSLDSFLRMKSNIECSGGGLMTPHKFQIITIRI